MKRRALSITRLYAALAAAASVLLFFLQSGGFNFICVFRELTGLRCPGCGNTNAVLAVLRGDFIGAANCNIMFYPEVISAAAFIIYLSYLYVSGKRASKHASAAAAAAVLAVLVWGIVRNIINI